MLAETVTGLGAIKTAFDIAKGLKDIDDASRRNAAVIELQEKILGAQGAQAALIERIAELEKKLAKLETWEVEKRRYKLTDVGSGALAYTLREGMEQDEPAHALCSSCYQAGYKSFLQTEHWQPNRCTVLVCHDCGRYYYVKGLADPAHQKLKPVPYRGP